MLNHKGIWMRDPIDGRDPRITWEPPTWTYKGTDIPPGSVHRPAIMINHNCARCNSGAKPCYHGDHSRCVNLHARND